MGRFLHGKAAYVYDDAIYMYQLDPETLILTKSYNFNGTEVPSGFKWNGCSSPNTPLARFIAPKFHRNIKATCVHDYLCGKAKNNQDRRDADMIYFLIKKYVEKDEPWKCTLALLGVHIGATLGIGNYFDD